MTTPTEIQRQVRANTRAGNVPVRCWVPKARKDKVEQFAKEAEAAVKKHEGEK